MRINWAPWNKIVNDAFVPYVNNKDRIVIHVGGRGSGKSDYQAKRLIYRCLSEKYFRFIIVRRVYDTIKDSAFQTLVDSINDLGLESLFHVTYSPLQITCKLNGNKFLARGYDKISKIKSVKDPTGVWYEEDIPSEKEFITITTCIRTLKADYLQEVFTINPEVEGDYNEHWFYKKFFKDKKELTFSSFTEIKVKDKLVRLNYSVHHSTYEDNRWIGDDFMAYLESLKEDNPYYYSIYCLGMWGNADPGKNPFIYSFKESIIDNTINYDKSKQLLVSVDFNVDPITAIFAHTYRNKGVECLDVFNEVAIMNGSIEKLAEYIEDNYSSSIDTMLLTGDAMGRNRNISERDNASHYDLLRGMLKLRQSQLLVTSNPTHKNSRVDCNFFLNKFKNIKINGINCKSLIFDFKNVQCDIYGDIIKRNRKDPSQKADLLDTFRYLINTFFKDWIRKNKSIHDRTKNN